MLINLSESDDFKLFRKWSESIVEHADENICVVVAGNITDENSRIISYKEASEAAA